MVAIKILREVGLKNPTSLNIKYNYKSGYTVFRIEV